MSLDPFNFYNHEALLHIEETCPDKQNNVLINQAKRKKENVFRKKKRVKRSRPIMSYIKTKEEGKGQRLIRINIFDISATSDAGTATQDGEDRAILSAQYVVVNPVDDILDQTVHLVHKISETISNKKS
ncbi:hypothetical protein O0L34_g19382 [Tuta absoluta]|nr:hypothetical protein O0L34_g19382 [Tuta absoluta]